MKTLDEVINALEDARVQVETGNGYWVEFSDNDDLKADALHYLREYKDRKETLRNWTEKAISEQQNLSDAITFMQAYRDDKDDLTALRAYWKEQHENNALTWEQLKKMEGKPVWLELLKGKWKGWDVIGGFDEDDFGVAMVTVRGDDYYKADLGKTWQAYRKERE